MNYHIPIFEAVVQEKKNQKLNSLVQLINICLYQFLKTYT